jgi:hypothetical protein
MVVWFLIIREALLAHWGEGFQGDGNILSDLVLA